MLLAVGAGTRGLQQLKDNKVYKNGLGVATLT